MSRRSGNRRRLVDRVRWRVRTGVPWRDQPREYGPSNTVYGLYRRRQREGVWGLDSPGGPTDAGEASGCCGIGFSETEQRASAVIPALSSGQPTPAPGYL
ncbi:transposase [Streptomyces sp. NPDC093224]|uniref:transposase n=1 Tax=Streptomyces sp. NPDC093224 TaxID=3155198 RepID=UPI00344225C5